MKKLLVIPMFVVFAGLVGCQPKQVVSQLDVGKDKLLDAGLAIEAVEHLKRAEQEESYKVEPRALLVIAYAHGLLTGDAQSHGLEAEYKSEKAQRVTALGDAEMKRLLGILSERHRIQKAVIQVVIDKGPSGIPLLIESLGKTRYQGINDDIMEIMRGIGAEGLNAMVAGIKDTNTPPSVKVMVVELIGQIGDPRVNSELEAIRSQTSDAGLKMAINTTLYKLGQKQYRDYIVMGLSDSDVTARRAAARVMVDLNDSPTAELVKALKDPDDQVKTHAAAAIQKYPDQRAVDPLVAILKGQGDLETKQAALDALDVHAQKGLAKGLAKRLIEELLSKELTEPNDRLRIVQLLKKESLETQIKSAPAELNLEWKLWDYREKVEDHDTVKDELDRLLLKLEKN